MYKLRVSYENYSEEIPLYVVNSQSWGGGVAVVVHEAAGTNGGVVMVTGRTNNVITLNGRFLARPGQTLQDLEDIKNKLDNIKNKGKSVVLIAPIGNNDTGIYIISELTGVLTGGMATSLPFTMTLTEYRQANLKRTKVNLISFEPAEEFKSILKQRQLSG